MLRGSITSSTGYVDVVVCVDSLKEVGVLYWVAFFFFKQKTAYEI